MKPIPIEELLVKFKKHLDIENNDRILFSGKFGSGKTYLLNKFFKKEDFKKEFFAIHLHPTNYQISDNEKVLDFIKTDIYFNIIEKSQGEYAVKMKKQIKEGKNLPFVKILFALGKSVPLIEKFIPVIEEAVNAFGEIKTESINKELNKIKKKKVLIIDDLDRIEPKHIFRIMNVFSSFVGEEGEKETEYLTFSEKLGFDKVIFVADYESLESIFKHIYGEKTNPSGYMDKFYSTKIYEYDLKKEIVYTLNEYIKTLLEGDNENNNNSNNSKPVVDNILLILIMATLIENGELDIRRLKSVFLDPQIKKYSPIENTGYTNYGDPAQRTRAKRTLEVLISLAGSRNNLITLIEEHITFDNLTNLKRPYGGLPFPDGVKGLEYLVEVIVGIHNVSEGLFYSLREDFPYTGNPPKDKDIQFENTKFQTLRKDPGKSEGEEVNVAAKNIFNIFKTSLKDYIEKLKI